MKRILLPTDFSENAYNGISYALQLFRDVSCTFYLTHTYIPPVYQAEYILGSPGLIGMGDVINEASLTQLELLQKRLVSEFGNSRHSFILRSVFSSLVYEVAETTESEAIDYLIMGTKGATGAREILLGTNTVSVIKISRCPVIAVPPAYKYEAPKEILFPTDYEVDYDKERFEALLHIARQHVSNINVLHIDTGYGLTAQQELNRRCLEKLLGSQGVFQEIADDEIIHAINSFQAREQINLLAMVRNKHTFLERLFIEPVIKKIGFHIAVPFLVIPS